MTLEYAVTAGGAQVAFSRRAAQRAAPSVTDRTGASPPTILYLPGGIYPVEAIDDDPPYRRFVAGLADLGDVLLVERRGIGASDQLTASVDVFQQWAEDAVAVLDATGTPHAAVVGYGPGATAALATALRASQRVTAVVALHPLLRSPSSASFLDDLGELFTRVVGRDADASDEIWALLIPSRADDPVYRSWNQRNSQLAASPGTARQLWEAVLSQGLDLHERLDEVTCPVLVAHRSDSAGLSARWSRAIADALPRGTFTMLAGADWVPNAGDVDGLVDAIATFLTGAPRTTTTHRALVALLFTDIVDSTGHLTARGDAQWTTVLDTHDQLVRRALARHDGTLVKAMGDGALATFPTPTGAVLGGIELRDALAANGVVVRMGVHLGEVDRRGDDVAGAAVHLAARIMGRAGPGEIWTSAAVPNATLGGPLRFAELGPHTLRGFAAPFALYRVRDTPSA